MSTQENLQPKKLVAKEIPAEELNKKTIPKEQQAWGYIPEDLKYEGLVDAKKLEEYTAMKKDSERILSKFDDLRKAFTAMHVDVALFRKNYGDSAACLQINEFISQIAASASGVFGMLSNVVVLQLCSEPEFLKASEHLPYNKFAAFVSGPVFSSQINKRTKELLTDYSNEVLNAKEPQSNAKHDMDEKTKK